MASPPPGTVVLFLASDPADPDRQAAHTPTATWLERTFVPPRIAFTRSTRAPSLREGEPGPFPAEQVMCAQRVVDQARKGRRTVRMVDVNEPGDARDLVQRFVTPADVLPVLVRADGARLVGAESFTPPSIRRFLAGS